MKKMPPPKMSKRGKVKLEGNESPSKTPSTNPWPTLGPTMPKENLALHHISDHVITIPSFWTAALCKKYVSHLATLPLTTTLGKPKKGEAVRVNDRFQVDDASFAEIMWSSTGLRELVLGATLVGAYKDASVTQEQQETLWGGEVLGLNPNIRIYRYRKGQYFDKHCESILSIFAKILCGFLGLVP